MKLLICDHLGLHVGIILVVFFTEPHITLNCYNLNQLELKRE